MLQEEQRSDDAEHGEKLRAPCAETGEERVQGSLILLTRGWREARHDAPAWQIGTAPRKGVAVTSG